MTNRTDSIQVLFIDDDPVLLNIAKLFLERSGAFLVTTVLDADEALNLLNDTTFDAIVSDYHMPKMDGIELLSCLKARGIITPFIIYTGRGREEVVIEALNKGADFYIQKSGNPKSEFAELASKIRYAVLRKKSERDLEQALVSLKRSQQVAHIGNWTLDPENMVFTASEEGLAILGFPAGYQVTLEEVQTAIHPDDRMLAQSTLIHLLKTGEPYNIDIRIYQHDSNEIRYIQTQGYLIVNGKDSNQIVFGTILDITNRKKIEEALSETNSYLENLINIASVPIIIIDPDLHITRINQSGEELIGQAADQVIGKSIRILFLPEKADAAMREIVSASDDSKRKSMEFEILHSDGSIRTVLWNSATLYDKEGGNPIATIAQGQDITSRLRLEKERNAAELQIQQNLAQLAILNDGIRNPLMAISGYAEIFGDHSSTEKILLQVQLINEMITQVDRRWAESEKILNFLRKHCEVETDSSEGDCHNNTQVPGTMQPGNQ